MSDGDNTSAPSDAVAEMMADDEYWAENYERERGMLTDTDRRFLWGGKTYESKVSRSDRRAAIRERAENGLRDLFYLPMLWERNREKVLDAIEEKGGPGELRSAVSSLVEFLYLGLDGDLEWLEETIAHGIANAERERRDDGAEYHPKGAGSGGVDVEITVREGYNVEHLERQLRSGNEHSLTPTEIGVLARSGRLDADDLEKLEPLDFPEPEEKDDET